MKLNQARFATKFYTLEAIIAAKTALTGEQAPLNQKTVDLIATDLQEGRELKQPIELTIYDGTLYLTGGRHRVAGILQSITETQPELKPAELEVKVLEYKVDTAEELLERILSSNESRRMTKSGEQKLLRTACKHGFVTVTVESLIAKVVDMTGKKDCVMKEARQLLIMALAMYLNREEPELWTSDTTANKFATSLIGLLAKGKQGTRNHIIETEKDGVKQQSISVEKFPIIEELLLTSGSDELHEFLFDVHNTLKQLTVLETGLPAALFSDALMTEALRDCVQADAYLDVPNGAYITTVKPPSALQYNVAGYARLVAPTIVSTLFVQ